MDALIAEIPQPHYDPVFRLGDDGVLHMASSPDLKKVSADDELLEELRAATRDLLDALNGTNAHADLLTAVRRYADAVSDGQLSISLLYARGVRLENAAYATQRAVEASELPSIPATVDEHLGSVLGLHRGYIMSRDDGRNLAQGAEDYQRSPDKTAKLKIAAEQLASALEEAKELFGDDVREHISLVTQDIGLGPNSARSNQVAANAHGNLIAMLLKKAGGIAIVAVVAGAIGASGPGGAVIADGAAAINTICEFLVANAHTLRDIAAVAGTDLAWLKAISYALIRVGEFRTK